MNEIHNFSSRRVMIKFKQILALLLALTMIVGLMGVAVYADDPAPAAEGGDDNGAGGGEGGDTSTDTSYGASNSHTITIAHNKATGDHLYKAYQVFGGNLDSKEEKLTDIVWGSSIKADKIADLLAAIVEANADDDSALKGKFDGIVVGVADDPETTDIDETVVASTAADVAKKVAELGDDSKALDAFAQLISKKDNEGNYLFLGTEAGSKTLEKDKDSVDINVTGDGYYMIIDETAELAEGDTYSKIMVNVVKDVTIKAKDDSLTPDKEIVDGEDRVKANTAAIGDTVTYEVKITVPDTTNYNFYKFVMKDQLPDGLTFDEIVSIKIDGTTTIAEDEAGTALKNTYTLTTTSKDANGNVVKDDDGNPVYGEYNRPSDLVASGTGGQGIKIVFNNFKETVETPEPNLIGKEIVITYKATVNADATYGAEYNENTVHFDFSNNPNHEYDGNNNDFGDGEPSGKTPDSTTETYVTTLEIFKYTGTNTALAGAEFEIASESYNAVVKTGEKFELSTEDEPYTAEEGEKIQQGATYYKLLDGSYTTNVPGAQIYDGEKALYILPDGTIITEDEIEDGWVEDTDYAKYCYNETQYESTTDTYVKVTYKVVDKSGKDAKKLTVISGEDGKINLDGLKPGVYTIKETVAPDGYNKIDDQYQLTIAWVDVDNTRRNAEAAATADTTDTADSIIKDEIETYLSTLTAPGVADADAALAQAKAKGGFYIAKAVMLDKDGANPTAAPTAFTLTYYDKTENEGGKYKIEILNQSGTELPSTGGIGTTIFYIVGGLLAVGAGVVLVTKKRMGKVDD